MDKEKSKKQLPDCDNCSAYKYCDTVVSSVKLCNSITNKQESKNNTNNKTDK